MRARRAFGGAPRSASPSSCCCHPIAAGARQLLLMMFIVEDLHFATLPLLCHRHPTSSRYGGALPPAVGTGAQPYTAGRPTPSQRLKNPMGPGGTGRPSSTQRSEKLVRDGFCENGLTGGCRGDFRRSPSHKSPPGSRHVRRLLTQMLVNQRLPQGLCAQVFRASP